MLMVVVGRLASDRDWSRGSISGCNSSIHSHLLLLHLLALMTHRTIGSSSLVPVTIVVVDLLTEVTRLLRSTISHVVVVLVASAGLVHSSAALHLTHKVTQAGDQVKHV